MGLGIKNGESNKMNKFVSEILAQPKSLEATLDYYSGDEGKRILKEIFELYHKEKFQHIIFTGMGSSYFVAYAASCLFNSLGIHSCVVNSSEFLYYHFSVISDKGLIVCISQSGESIEVVKLLKEIPENIVCIGISNEETSSLTERAKTILLSKAGKEEMTSTKTYTSMTLLSFILGWYFAGKWDENKIAQVRKLISDCQAMLSDYKNLISSEMDFFGDIKFLQCIGRGPSYSTALQSELMLKEASKLPAAGTLGGEFRHGPMEMVKAGFNAILFAAEGNTYKQSIKMASDIASYNGKVIIITNKDPKISDPNVRQIIIDQPDEFLFSIQSIIPVQLMVNHLAIANGYEPGNFVHGSKVTLAE